MNKLLNLFTLFTGGLLLLSCASSKLTTTAVAYLSVRAVEYKENVPDDAKIVVGYSITGDGALVAVVRNLTNEIMIIDQTKSFFVNSDGSSTSYYDPTIRTTSNTNYTSTTDGVSVNLGAVGGALGIGGVLGGILNGINVSESNTTGSATTNTVQFADQPQISLAPKSHGMMSKNFQIHGVGRSSLSYMGETFASYTADNSNLKFSVCISYSLDDGQSFQKLITPLYVNSTIVSPVKSHGKVNDALRVILSRKTDAIHEPWWMLYSVNNMDYNDSIWDGAIIDYQ